LPLALLGGFVPGVAAAILGGIGLSKASKTGAPNKGFAVAALVLAGFAIIIIPAGWAVITVIAASS
jgi:hypothetical protein